MRATKNDPVDISSIAGVDLEEKPSDIYMYKYPVHENYHVNQSFAH